MNFNWNISSFFIFFSRYPNFQVPGQIHGGNGVRPLIMPLFIEDALQKLYVLMQEQK